MNVYVVIVVLLLIAAAFWWFKVRKEKFVMHLYRPTYVTKIPENEFDPASILTAVMPQGMNKPPKLAVELGDYRRFQRV